MRPPPEPRPWLEAFDHDARAALTALRGGLEILGRRAEQSGDPIDIELIESLEANTRRLEMLIQNLSVSFSKGKSTAFPKESVDLAPLALRLALAFQTEARRAGVELSVDLPGGEFLVFGSESMIERIMANLLSNAIKYTPEGGKVVVRVGRTDSDVWFEVCDTGIGVPDSERERILEWGYRTEGGKEKSRTGLGLGLAICKDGVEAHAGRLIIRSEVGGGSVFRVELPRERT